MFQFPSNGKADPKLPQHKEKDDVAQQVSIPFKRESGSKELLHALKHVNSITVSIPFKRESGSKDNLPVRTSERENQFQFPSNGKADPKEIRNSPEGVSISFNSLQTGKRIQRRINRNL